MNGQYLMNKEISVQYAYKKDGKGERHGDQAERMLAAQARKHNVQPQSQALPPQITGGPPPPMVPTPIANGDISQPMSTGPQEFGAGRGVPMPNAPYANIPPQPPHRPIPPPQPIAASLTMPPAGLPARPPPSQAGYGGPPPGFAAPPRYGQPAPPPPGFGPPPVGAHGPPPGQLPPGFQQPGYGRGR